MLRKRSRAMTTSTKQAQQSLMAENGSLQSPTQMKPISSFFNSPRFFSGFSVKGSISETESAMSPTSILDNKSFSAIGNPFWTDKTHPTSRLSPDPSLDNYNNNNNKHPWEKKPEGIVDVLDDDDDDNDQTSNEFSKPKSRMVLFGSQLKIQIPSLPPSVLISPTESPNSPADFGIKTRNTQIRSLSFSSPNPPGPETPVSPFTGCLSASEMELSEDYTCVISHDGPNPRTTHIFGDYIVENCCGFITLSSTKESYGSVNRNSYPSEEFLSFCYHCKRNLGHGKDIYMYRGEKAFCSRECRFEEMELDEAAME